MRKILTVLILIAYLLSSLIFITNFSTDDLKNIKDRMKTKLTIFDLKEMSPNEFLRKIEQSVRKNKINIQRTIYSPKINNQKEKIIIYIYAFNEKDYFKNINFKSGRYFTKNDNENLFISSEETKDPNQIGQIEMFNGRLIVEIRPLIKADNENINGTYEISTDKSSIISNFQNDLLSSSNIVSKLEKSMEIVDNFDERIYQISILLFCIYILIFLTFLYSVLLRYKELAIKKMFSYSNSKLVFDIIFKEIFAINIICLSISSIIMCIGLKFYNNFAQIINFLKYCSVYQVIFMLILQVLFLIQTLFFRNIKISFMIKNKKPLTEIQFLNYISKIVFSIIIISIGLSLFQSIRTVMNQNSNSDKWCESKNYAIFRYSPPKINSIVEQYKEGAKSKKLFELTNNNGGMLISPSSYLSTDGAVNNHGKDYSPHKNTICINNNYLKVNPIKDLNGNNVIFKNDYEFALTLLVPQKYKSCENDIISTYKKWYTWKRFVDEDAYNEEMGYPKVNHIPLEIKIIFLKNNQKYFTYDPKIAINQRNYLKDPVVMIVNNVNFGTDSYLNFLTSGTYFGKVKDSKNPLKSLREYIGQADLSQRIFSTPSLYSKISETMYSYQKNMAQNILAGCFTVSILIIIIVFTTLNYLDKNKSILSVKKLHGYSFSKRHENYYLFLILFWIIILIAFIIRNDKAFMLLSLIVPLMLFLELIIATLVICFAESRKQKETLKGG